MQGAQPTPLPLPLPLPSVLDSPRFFNDDALSAWKIDEDERDIVATQETMKEVGFKPFTTEDVVTNNLQPSNLKDGDPIIVEIVRGLRGPNDDSWSVVVDGVVQKEGFNLKREETQEGYEYVCKLPPGIVVDNLITKDTLVRPVVISVRLEEESLSPLSVTGSFTQVLKTSEYRNRREEYAEKKEMEVKFDIDPYRVANATSKVALVQYPFWAPAQSSLGILSFFPAKREAERKKAAAVYNSVAGILNGVSSAFYQGRMAQYRDDYVPNVVSSRVSRLSRKLPKKLSKKLPGVKIFNRVLPTPKKPASFKRLSQPSTETYNDDNKVKGSTVIGGKTTSSIEHLSELFATLIDVCEKVQEEFNKRGGEFTIKDQLVSMRLALLTYYDNPKALALFDALHTTDILPTTAFLLDETDKVAPTWENVFEEEDRINVIRSKFAFKRCDPRPGIAIAIPDQEDLNDDFEVYALESLTSEQQGAALGIANDYFKNEREIVDSADVPYMFVYDRLRYEERSKTMLTSHININVKEYNSGGKPFRLRLESSEEDGYEAHAVYTNVVSKIEDLDKLCIRFLDCMFLSRIRASAETGNTTTNAVFDQVGWFNQFYNKNLLKRIEEKNSGIRVDGIVDALKLAGAGSIAKFTGRQTAAGELNLDFCKIEKRVAELRIMARQLLPPSRIDTLRRAESDLERLFEGEIDEDEDEVERLTQRPDTNAAEYIPAEEETEKKLDEKRLESEYIEELRRAFPLPSTPSTESDIKALVIRQLPQVVIPSKMIQPVFLPYTSVNPLIVPYTADGWRARDIGPLAVVGAVGFVGFSSFVAAAEATTALAATGTSALTIISSLGTAGSGLLFGGFLGLGVAIAGLFTRAALTSGVTYFTQPYVDAFNAFKLYSGATSFAIKMGSIGYSFARLRISRREEQVKLFYALRQKMIGQPINACLAAARNAMSNSKREIQFKERDVLFGDSNSKFAVYNHVTGDRINFYQYYASTNESAVEDAKKKKDVLHVHGDIDFVRVPDPTALYLLPPEQVSRSLYEAETLRGIPLERMTSFVAGKSDGMQKAAKTPEEIAAQSFLIELRQVVRRSRQTLKGEHLLQSEYDCMLQLVESASSLISSVYGLDNTLTFVRSDDILWTCLKGGVVSRLALRHLPMFQQLQSIQATSDVKLFVNYYTRQRMSLMNSYANALKTAVKQIQKDIRQFPLINIKSVASSMSSSLFRVNCMLNGNSTLETRRAVLGLVASAAANDLLVSRSALGLASALGEFRFEILSGVSSTLKMPRIYKQYPVRQHTTMEASWASRRVEINKSRNYTSYSNKNADKTDRESTLISDFSGLGFESTGENETSEASVYYCPMGNRIENTPTASPFMVEALSMRQINLNQLVECIEFIEYRIVSAKNVRTDPEGATLTIREFEKDEQIGFARHPLSIVSDNERILVHLVNGIQETNTPFECDTEKEPTVAECKVEQDDTPHEIYTVDALINGSSNSDLIRSISISSRIIGFNAERLLFAIDLAQLSVKSTKTSLVFDMKDSHNALSFVIAASMSATSRSGSTAATYQTLQPSQLVLTATLRTEDDLQVEEVTRLLASMKRRIQSALERGVEDCTLSELVICIAKL